MNEYYEDEYDAIEEWEEQIKEWSSDAYLYKAPNGQLVMIEVSGWCYWGQDWGETADQWNTDYVNLSRLKTRHRLWCIYLGREMEAGQTIPYYYPDIEELISEKKAHIWAIDYHIEMYSRSTSPSIQQMKHGYIDMRKKAERELKDLEAILEVERV